MSLNCLASSKHLRHIACAIAVFALAGSAPGYPPGGRYHSPLKKPVAGEATDEAGRGETLIHKTPVAYRTDRCFPAEPRDVFWEMDQAVWKNKETGKLEIQPLDFDEDQDGTISDDERDAIRGRNTWLLWGGGNETFWGWLQERGYGLVDFLILMDSRERANRFKTAGLINQPGFEASTRPLLGLYFDQPRDGKWENAMLTLPPGPDGTPLLAARKSGYDYLPEPDRYDTHKHALPAPVPRPALPGDEVHRDYPLFEPWTTPEARAREWAASGKSGQDPWKDYVPDTARAKLPQDGLDPSIYGYPSGIFGLRLMLNPDFFGKTKRAAEARQYWKKQVEETKGRYYTDASIHSDPELVRPFRVSMSCGFCHVAQHPLKPPVDNAEPKWENLSSIIGAQYWDPQPAFGNLAKRPSFLHHFLKSQAPGTIDTSLVSTDHINNTNVINPIFDVPSRLARAAEKPTETQDENNLLLPSIEDPETGNRPDSQNKERHFPMVLGPGEDSVGVFGALARVPLNIGVFSEEWHRTGNLILGFTPQRPFSIAVNRANSVYWNTNEKYRVPYMAKFFHMGYQGKVAKSTAAMKLKYAGAEGAKEWTEAGKNRARGREVFLNNCAICHSSKQPQGYDLRFSLEAPGGDKWDNASVPPDSQRLTYTLPMEYQHWEDYKKSPSYKDYVAKLREYVATLGPVNGDGEDDPFVFNNFLSNELRIPITLTGTYSGRAMATNAMAGHVWDNYSSVTFKNLDSVGNIRYFNPYRAKAAAMKFDAFGTNDEYNDGRKKGGPGYFRPATLISIWATAPFFHNNALGIYTQDTTVNGRLVAFDDAIRKLLWNNQRPGYERGGVTYVPPGDLRADGSAAAANDPGYIYRLPVDTHIQFEPGFTPLIFKGLLIGFTGITTGNILFTVLSFWWWVVLAAIFLILVIKGRTRHAGLLLLLLAALLAGGLGLLGIGSIYFWLLAAALWAFGFCLLLTTCESKWLVRVIFVAATVVTLFVGILSNKFLTGRLKAVNPVLAVLPNGWLNGEYKGIDIGPIPRGTPVNLLMNMDPAKTQKMGPAALALVRAMLQINKEHLTGDAAYNVFAKVAGQPLMEASKCPDFVLDRGHWFGEALTDEEKEALIAFLKTL